MRVGLLGAVLVLAACSGAQAERVKLSGRTETRPVAVGAFDKVELKGSDRVVVRVGGSPSVSISGDAAVLDTIEAVVDDGKLVVRRKGQFWMISGGQERATVNVTVPKLAAAAVGGSGEMSVDRISGSAFSAAVGGSGDLRIGRVEADKMKMAIGGSGSIQAAGRVRSVEASIGGSGDILASRLQAETAEVSIGGSGSANVYARTLAQVSIAGSGDAVVNGGARCKTSKVGSGSVRCGGRASGAGN